MLQAEARARFRQNPRTTRADSKLRGKRFRRYKGEEAKAVRVPKVKEDATLRQLREAWRRYLKTDSKEIYGLALDLVRGISYTAKDVEKFSLVLAEFQGEQLFATSAGIFLSALINNCEDNEFVIHTEHLDTPIDNFGYKNTKRITVIGNAGGSIGYGMEGGSIGYGMEGGSITVKGNILAPGLMGCVGQKMQGGTITIEGDAGEVVGEAMEGGEIHLEGSYRSISNFIWGGKIFHRGVEKSTGMRIY